MDTWRARLAAFVASQLPSADVVEIGPIRPMPAGASNDTAAIDLRVSAGGITWALPLVLRPQREHGILAPYDVKRQFDVMRALAATPVPVPTVIWHSQDLSVLGTPFYFMQRVRGEALPLLWYGGRSPRLLAAAEALASVHAVDWARAGLGFLDDSEQPRDRARSPLAAELGTWRRRIAGSPVAASGWFIALGDYLIRNEPSDARVALLHGDPNPGNYLFRGDEVVAVLDWELATVGDPRSDLGFYAALSTTFGGMSGRNGSSVLSDAYQSVTGTALGDLAFYEAFGLYRIAALLASGHGGFNYYGMDSISRRLAELLGPRWAA